MFLRTIILVFILSASLNAEWVNLWPGPAPAAKTPPKGTEILNENGHLTDIEVPQYEL